MPDTDAPTSVLAPRALARPADRSRTGGNAGGIGLGRTQTGAVAAVSFIRATQAGDGPGASTRAACDAIAILTGAGGCQPVSF